MKTACLVNIRNYPFDLQDCPIILGLWNSDELQVRLQYLPSAELIDMTFLEANGEWVISSKKWSDSSYFFDDITLLRWRIILKRKSQFYIINIIVPLVILSFLNVLCYLVPDASGEKMTLSISMFLSYIVFLTLISDSMPTSSDQISILGVTLIFNLLQSGLTILLSVISLNIYHQHLRFRLPTCFPMTKLYPSKDNISQINEGEIDETVSSISTVQTKRFNKVCFIVFLTAETVSWLIFLILLTKESE